MFKNILSLKKFDFSASLKLWTWDIIESPVSSGLILKDYPALSLKNGKIPGQFSNWLVSSIRK